MASRYIPKKVKEAVIKRDGNKCRLCGYKSEYMEFDHITPYSKGAPATVENIQLICRKCNLEKKAKTPKCEKCSSWIPYGSQYCQKCGATQKKVVHNFTPSGRNRISTTKIVGVLLILLALYLMAKR